MNKKESKKALLPKLHQTTLGDILETAPFFQFEDNDIKWMVSTQVGSMHKNVLNTLEVHL